MNDKLVMSNERRSRPSRDAGIQIDDVKFHQCVRLGKFDRDRAITFIPPDGVFELMSYRVTENINLPFKIVPLVHEFGTDRVEMNVKIRSLYEKNLFATNVIIKVPCPTNTSKCNIFSSSGKAKYEPD
jgi:AP-2 complex subunit mu-1